MSYIPETRYDTQKKSVPGIYRITRKIAHPGDNILLFKMLSPVVLLCGDVLSKESPLISAMHGSPAARGCGNEGRW